MTSQQRLWPLFLAVGALALAALACDPGARSVPTRPSVTILSPEPRSSTVVGEPLEVDVMAEDPLGPGVVRLDLQWDGLVVDTFESPGPQPSLDVSLTVTPSEEGAASLSIVAYRVDGTPSDPAAIAISVTGDGTAATEDTSDEDAAPPAAEESPSEVADVEARAIRDVDVLEEPGVGCEVIGQVPRDEVIDLLRRTTGPTDHYYQTNYLGADELGWVLNEPLELQVDDDDLPRDPQATCLYCGDGTCSAGDNENCSTCADDCGACGPVCGNEVCEAGEALDSCEYDCCNPGALVPGTMCCGANGCFSIKVCGDGICQDMEVFDCPQDCEEPTGGGEWGMFNCGNGTCDGAEDCNNCPQDCPICILLPDLFCGDGVCDLTEDCCTCGQDCSPPSGSLCSCGP